MDAILTREILEDRWNRFLVCSEAAIRKHPELFREIKRHLESVFSRSIDVSEYYPLARKLSEMLRELGRHHEESIFAYFGTHLDPQQAGDPRYFRAMCLDLIQQIQQIEQWRMQGRSLRRIK